MPNFFSHQQPGKKVWVWGLGHKRVGRSWTKKTWLLFLKLKLEYIFNCPGQKRKIPFCLFALPNSYSQEVQQQLNGTHNDIIDWNHNRREWEERVGGKVWREGGKDVFVLLTKDKFCSSAGTNEEPDEGINWGKSVFPIVSSLNSSFTTPSRFVPMDGQRNSSVCVFLLEEEAEEQEKSQTYIFKLLWIRRWFKGLVRF